MNTKTTPLPPPQEQTTPAKTQYDSKKLISANGKVSTTTKKPALARKKSRPFPNKETQWSYFMQAIEPNSTEINIAFPEYHPMWVIQSQRKSVSAKYFRFMREQMLSMTRKQCAAYPQVSDSKKP